MRIVVTGCKGQLARSLLEQARGLPGTEVILIGRPQLDLTDPPTILAAIEPHRPDLVVSAAAFTAVDQAEGEPETAFAVNAFGAEAVAGAAASLGAPVLHVSTDYVFDGSKHGSYAEDDMPAPFSVYGASKLAGELAVAEANPRHVILRTGWVYSPFGKNFIKTILRLAGEREEIAVVADQWGNPTSALDLADAILGISAQLTRSGRDFVFGLYHLAGAGTASRADLARHALSASRAEGGPWAHVRDVATSAFPTPARRPTNSSLSSAKFTAAFRWSMPPWQYSVECTVRRLVQSTSSETI
ncbi:dTDP-4-dehydrorhamnose reductase [Sinorhizobium medicae]|uniref:dTDP-4-dehydrorhamnose reductase n=1 Tax=Sinorhizobium medicae TaxID=110321 RepID=A0A508X3D9_9HYPH|nr:dTDP-4-dehydrorhamnose reductase [Sinorhizobium medicae]MBO1941804.1 dTDP-4-dehydrorhamnose reductase [Sinorhizobium medicae]MDX0520742.1 dTDP-4-dehydrorhamnose reductase [Sinorhizobium medicae]MDX0630795.1 dTDP-4-dehydrorhamnose reductase [Sinorhizobium medicae]MDX0714589.1 dTDP-4-dehydrorhamnose reductase [Sinorhizobium medicae]MDX0767026.1 dTDP-4-dehydrorhamnose reductase [Sinorhizobium medicae]